MNLANITHTSLTQQLGQEVPEVYVVIAKHQAAGLGNESIAEIIGCDPQDIKDVESEQLFVTVRQTIGALVAASQADQGLIWDSLESIAGKRLLDRIEHERDPEFLLRVAATANRMQRRAKPSTDILDPSRAGRAAITLTSRMVQRITQAGHREVVEEKSLSISDGSMGNPTFEEVDKILSIRESLTPGKIPIQEEGLLLENLEDDLMRRLDE